MSAPTVVYIESTQTDAGVQLPASATSFVSSVSVSVGDLCVVTAESTFADLGSGTQPAINYASSGADASFAKDGFQSSVNSANSVAIWSKVLTSSEISGGKLIQFSVNFAGSATPARAQLWIFRHANGFDSSRVLSPTPIYQTANITNGTETQSLTDSAQQVIAITIWGGSSQPTQTVTWDGGTAQVPYVDESSSTQTDGVATHHYGSNAATCQVDFKLYDTSDTPTSVKWLTGTANTAHIVATIEYVTRNSAQTASKTDSLGLTDSTSRTSTYGRTITDALGLTDAASVPGNARSATITDALGLTDSTSRTSSTRRTITDPLGFTDTILVGGNTHYTITKTDSLGLTDAAQRAYRATITDALGLTDNGTTAVGATETLNLDDDVEWVQDSRQTITDRAGLTDTIEVQGSGTIQLTLRDALGLTDLTFLPSAGTASFKQAAVSGTDGRVTIRQEGRVSYGNAYALTFRE